MSPLYEHSEVALSFILVIGAVTAFFMGLLGVVQNDIKRVIAYSTLSQLGYMAVALGASAYAAAIFHLVTHAFFKALLFLAAGSVIIAMHHEQDMRKMGGLYRYMPITWFTALIGSLALCGIPGFAGFYSKDAIIDAVHHSHLPGAELAYWSVAGSVFITGLYTFRLFFMTFHGKERVDRETWSHLHESPKVVTVPLVALAIPSVIAGGFLIGPMLFHGYFGSAIFVAPAHDVLARIDYHGILSFTVEAFRNLPVYLSFGGIAVAWLLYIKYPKVPGILAERFSLIYRILVNKYGFDEFNQKVFAGGTRAIGRLLWHIGDETVIDGVLINGTADLVRRFAGVVRNIQSGYLYHYAFTMIIGLLVLLAIFVHHIIALPG
jgi:NADH-quinone oxidoreductase subunit L